MDRYKRAWFQNQSSCSPSATMSQPTWPRRNTSASSVRSPKWLLNISPKRTTSATRTTSRHFTAVLYPDANAADLHSSVGHLAVHVHRVVQCTWQHRLSHLIAPVSARRSTWRTCSDSPNTPTPRAATPAARAHSRATSLVLSSVGELVEH